MSDASKILKDMELVRGQGRRQRFGRLLRRRFRIGDDSAPIKGSSLEGKILLLYFSAHWCPPCRRFTPVLASLYGKLKDQGKNVECVFVSSDNDEKEYNEYLSEMPWLAVPYSHEDERQNLASKCGASGIPHLVVLDEDGSVITTDGTGEVQLDKDGSRFPWRPPSFSELWPESFERAAPSGKEGEYDLVPSSELKDKHLMLYFSAHWCPPCQRFTSALCEAYTKMKGKSYGDDFELIFVSSDRTEEQYREYRKEMLFPALPFAEREAKDRLSRRFQVQGIPTLIILSPEDENGERKLINRSVRGYIDAGDLDAFPFPPVLYGNVESEVGEHIFERQCLVACHENGDDDEQEDARKAVRAGAEVQKTEGKDDARFFWSLETGGIGDKIREVLKMKNIGDEAKAGPPDIPDRGGFYVMDEGGDAMDAERLAEFVRSNL